MRKEKIRFLVWGVFILIVGAVSLKAAASPVKIEKDKKISLNYKLFVEGALVEAADAKQPFTYTHGQHQIVPGLEKNLTGLKVGDKKTVRISPEEAFGPIDPKQFWEVDKTKLPKDIPLKVGTMVEARSPQGEIRLVKIREIKPTTVVLDFNHPLAGKELEFQVEVLNIA